MKKGGGEQERPVGTGDRCCRKSDDRSDAFVRGENGGSLWRDTEDRRVKESRSPEYKIHPRVIFLCFPPNPNTCCTTYDKRPLCVIYASKSACDHAANISYATKHTHGYFPVMPWTCQNGHTEVLLILTKAVSVTSRCKQICTEAGEKCPGRGLWWPVVVVEE